MLESLVSKIRLNYSKGLPGQEAQYRLVPPGRVREDLNTIHRNTPKKAAVLALIYQKGDLPHMVFMRRNTYPGVHSNQISFPGGKFEPEDTDLKYTALRESQEELGINPASVEIIGSLTQVYIPPSNFLVQPYLGFSKDPINFIPDESEVTEVLEFPVTHFRDDSNIKTVKVDARGVKFNVPAYVIEENIIWGATAMMLSEISSLLGDRS